MIRTIVIPTPNRIKRLISTYNFKETFKKYITKERILMYSLIGTGLMIIAINNPFPGKPFVIAALVYNVISYEILDWWYDEVLDEEILKYLIEKNITFTQYPSYF